MKKQLSQIESSEGLSYSANNTFSTVGVLGHLHVWWCYVTLQVVLLRNGMFHNTLKKCSKVL